MRVGALIISLMIFCLVLGGFTPTIVIADDCTNENGEGFKETPLTLERGSGAKGLQSRAPIYIQGNSNFTAVNGVTRGSGTENDPYIIEGWDIEANSANGIDIRYTDVYFVIRNCSVHDGKSNLKQGVWFSHVSNGKMYNVTSYNNSNGVYLTFSSNNMVIACCLYDNLLGIQFGDSCWNNEVHYCNVYNNSHCGILNCESDAAYQTDAACCWWGAPDGPSGRGNGSGDTVSANILYDPWLTEPLLAGRNAPPLARFTYSPAAPTPATVIQFTDTSYEPDGSIVSWFWDFGDGNTSISANPKHQYTATGNYTVNLTVTDDDGASNTYSRIVVIYSVEAIKPHPPNLHQRESRFCKASLE